MRKVKNSKAIGRLSKKSFEASRTRNIIAAVAIALTAILFTAVFTIGLGMVETSQRNTMRQVGTDMRGVIKNLTKEQYEIMRKHPSITEEGIDIAVSAAVTNTEFLKRHLEMHYRSENLYQHDFIEILDGRAPQAADEALMDEKSMELLGLEAKAGQRVTIKMRVRTADTEEIERAFTVSGVIRAVDGMNVGFLYVSESYVETYADELFPMDENVGGINMSVNCDGGGDIQQKLYKIITDSGFSTDDREENYVASNANWAYMSQSASSDPANIIGIGAALLLILVTGYLIIYNIFQISVIRDIRYYGLLKTIGTTGRQIKKILRRQALTLCVLGIPAGLLLGYLAGKVLLPVIMTTGGSSYAKADVKVSPQLKIFVGAALFTVITVLISEWKPGRIAAKVSPVEALHYTEQRKGKKKLKKSMDGGKIARMAFSNLGRNKGRTAVVICSLSLTVILLNSIYTVSHSLDREGFLSKMILSEAVIGNAQLWNYGYRPFDEETAEEENLTETFISACEEQECFLEGGRIYGDVTGVKLALDSWKMPDYIEKDENGIPGCWKEGRWNSYGLYGEKGELLSRDLMAAYFGIEKFILSKMTVIEGEKDPDAIWEKLQTGKYLIYGADVDDDNAVIHEAVKHHAGEKITLMFDGDEAGKQTEKEYEILSVIKRHQYSLSNLVGNDFEYYVTSEEFKKHCPESFLMNYLLDTKEGGEAEMETFLNNYTENVEPAMNYQSRTMVQGQMQELLGTVTLVGTLLAAMIGLIGILNYVNTLLTGMVTRKREFAMMEAIGMTKRQLVGMLTVEGVCYAGITIVCSLLLSSAFSLGIVRMLGSGIWFLKYQFTLLPVFLASPVLLLLGILVPGIVYRLRRQESIVEEIRE